MNIINKIYKQVLKICMRLCCLDFKSELNNNYIITTYNPLHKNVAQRKKKNINYCSECGSLIIYRYYNN